MPTSTVPTASRCSSGYGDFGGPVGPDTIYGFVPALGLGGALLPERAEIFDGPTRIRRSGGDWPRDADHASADAQGA